MANLSSDDVRHLASLAKIKLTDDEVKQYQKDLSSILNYVEQLEKVDTSDYEPTSQVTGLQDVSREDDQTNDAMSRDKLLDQAPKTDGKSLKVPKVI